MSSARTGTAGRAALVHEALVYDSDEAFLAIAVPFLRAGVAAGEPTLLGGDEHQQRLVCAALGDLPGLTLLDYSARGHSVTTLREIYLLRCAHIGDGATQIRVLGGIPHVPWKAWARVEAAVNHFLSPLPIWEICPYDTRCTPNGLLADVRSTHPRLALKHGQSSLSDQYEDPAAFLNRYANAEVDVLEASAPDLKLVNPSPAAASRAALLLTEATQLDNESADIVQLSVSELVTNALEHGFAPVLMRAWATRDRVVITIRDAGPGPADPFTGLLPLDPRADPDQDTGLYLIHQAASQLTTFTDKDGFTARLVQHACPG